jgi:hypothetical protein
MPKADKADRLVATVFENVGVEFYNGGSASNDLEKHWIETPLGSTLQTEG